jgi:hypothetical protein
MKYGLIIILALLLTGVLSAQTIVEEVCPTVPIARATEDFEPSGIIITSFDSTSLWVYDIARATRYPLPDTAPCTSNCKLSPDATWLSYYNSIDNTMSMMRLNGTDRRIIARRAIDIDWWSWDKLLIWSTIKAAFLQMIDDPIIREPLDVTSIIAVQPNGYWGVRYQQIDDDFQYQLINLQDRTQFIPLTTSRPFQNNVAWSPDGQRLVYTGDGAYDASVGTQGAELFAISTDTLQAEQLTYLAANYGAVRINGHDISGLSWSPDSTKVAFWVMELFGADSEINVGQARIHILDVITREIKSYCGYSTDEHTPNPPKIVWSPDSTHIAFAGNIPDDDKGYLLLAMNTETGNMTEFSDGVHPNYGAPDIIAWGYSP